MKFAHEFAREPADPGFTGFATLWESLVPRVPIPERYPDDHPDLEQDGNGVSRSLALHVLNAAEMPWRKATADDVWQEDDGAKRVPNADIVIGSLTKRYRHSWNGRYLLVTEQRTGSQLLHELAHWLVVPRSRRGDPEYGLGEPSWDDIAPVMTGAWQRTPEWALEGPQYRDINPVEIELAWQRLVGTKTKDVEESLASILQIVFLKELGLDWRAAVSPLGRAPHSNWARRRTWDQFAADDRRWWPPHVRFLRTTEAFQALRAHGILSLAKAICKRVYYTGGMP